MVIGFLSENIYRDVSVFRPFYRPASQVPFAKPRSDPDDGIGRDGFYDRESEAFRVTAGLLTAFYEMARRDGAEAVILIFPDRGDLDRWRSARTKRYAPLLRFLSAKGVRVVDAMAAFDAAGDGHSVEEQIPVHLSPLGNQLVAESLYARLRGFGLLP